LIYNGLITYVSAYNMGEMRNAYKILVRKPERKRPHERPRCKWDDNIRMDLKEIGWKVWTGCIWLRIGTGGRLLWGLCSMEFSFNLV